MGSHSSESRRKRKERYRTDPEFRAKRAGYAKSWKRRNHERFKALQRKRYGYPEPTRPAPHRCECCGGVGKKALGLDHDHSTGIFRGWLCVSCNSGIGMLGDDIEGLQRALRYLIQAYSGNQPPTEI